MSLSSQKYGFGIRDPGSGKNLFRIPDPGVKKAPDPGSATLVLFNQKLSLSSRKYGSGSGIRDPEKPYPGIKKTQDTDPQL
jgi:hypothetical protein